MLTRFRQKIKSIIKYACFSAKRTNKQVVLKKFKGVSGVETFSWERQKKGVSLMYPYF